MRNFMDAEPTSGTIKFYDVSHQRLSARSSNSEGHQLLTFARCDRFATGKPDFSSQLEETLLTNHPMTCRWPPDRRLKMVAALKIALHMKAMKSILRRLRGILGDNKHLLDLAHVVSVGSVRARASTRLEPVQETSGPKYLVCLAGWPMCHSRRGKNAVKSHWANSSRACHKRRLARVQLVALALQFLLQRLCALLATFMNFWNSPLTANTVLATSSTKVVSPKSTTAAVVGQRKERSRSCVCRSRRCLLHSCNVLL
jgi:hypothetical protein